MPVLSEQERAERHREADRFVRDFSWPDELASVPMEHLEDLRGRACRIFCRIGDHRKLVACTIKYIGFGDADGVYSIVLTLDLVTFFDREVQELVWTPDSGWTLHYYDREPLDIYLFELLQ